MRRTWSVIVLAFAAVLLVYGLVLALVTSSMTGPAPGLPLTSLRWVLYGLGAAALAGGLLFFMRTLDRTDLTPSSFMVRTVVSLALVETAAMFGFALAFLSRSLIDYLPPGAAAFGAILLWIFPRGLSHWSNLEGGTGR
jgi:F0F1-type ATP synthase membrane subunit c/vacuolar-type H+-ATPase subunit K